MVGRTESASSALNPLDNVEELLCDQNWIYDRTDDDCLRVQVKGRSCNYQLLFIWQRNLSALQFSCEFEMKLAPENMTAASSALLDMNEESWMGHFEIARKSLVPSYRQTCLLRGYEFGEDNAYFEDLIDISLAHCERFYPVFHLLSQSGGANSDALSLALMETAGES
ncbi:MAG: YbjN domain-containing protein [Alphaproteobacteria bacterium]|nr:YbjN domain-containing protein [Alphaproteobacteria bacterium]MCB9975946.1 YbjN domain-containing protein [Rhodospirillales bacterium]